MQSLSDPLCDRGPEGQSYALLVLAAAAWDGWRRRWSFSAAALIGALPVLDWIVYAANYLFGSRAPSWIGPPDYVLLEGILAWGFGLWPLSKLLLILLLLLPAVVPVLAVQFGALSLNRFGRGCAIGVLGVLLASWWGPGFPNWILLWGECVNMISSVCYQAHRWPCGSLRPTSRVLNLSDRMAVGMGRIPSDLVLWGDADHLEKVWLRSRCFRRFGMPAVDFRRQWRAGSNLCNHKSAAWLSL